MAEKNCTWEELELETACRGCLAMLQALCDCDLVWFSILCTQGLGDGLREKEKGSLLRSHSPSHQGLCCWPSILGSLPLSAELARITPAPFRAERDPSSVALLFSRNHRKNHEQ